MKYFVIVSTPEHSTTIIAIYKNKGDAINHASKSCYFDVKESEWEDGEFPKPSEMKRVL